MIDSLRQDIPDTSMSPGGAILFDGISYWYGARCFVQYVDALMLARRIAPGFNIGPGVVSSHPSPTVEQWHRMNRNGITFWASTYHYGQLAFDELEDALREATSSPVA